MDDIWVIITINTLVYSKQVLFLCYAQSMALVIDYVNIVLVLQRTFRRVWIINNINFIEYFS